MEHGQLWDAGVLGPIPRAWAALGLPAQGPLCEDEVRAAERVCFVCVFPALVDPVFLGWKEHNPGQ